MRRLCLVLVAILSLPAVAAAQEPITGYEFRIYAAGAAAPQIVTPVPMANVTCNLTKVTPPAGTAVNPNTALWDDPANATRDCRWVMTAPSPGPIVALPSGSYTGTLVAINGEGSSPESAPAPFLRQRSPAAPIGIRLTR